MEVELQLTLVTIEFFGLAVCWPCDLSERLAQAMKTRDRTNLFDLIHIVEAGTWQHYIPFKSQ